jgi:hypothetical protein
MLILSNQQDGTQQGDAFFIFDDEVNMLSAEALWMNALRRDYCDTYELPRIQYYYATGSRAQSPIPTTSWIGWKRAPSWRTSLEPSRSPVRLLPSLRLAEA